MSRILQIYGLRLAAAYWCVTESGNFAETGTLHNWRNILHRINLARGAAECHFRRKVDSPPLERKSAKVIQGYEKVLADWNGLMIATLARASIALNNSQYLDAAVIAYRFIIRRNIDLQRLVLNNCFVRFWKSVYCARRRKKCVI